MNSLFFADWFDPFGCQVCSVHEVGFKSRPRDKRWPSKGKTFLYPTMSSSEYLSFYNDKIMFFALSVRKRFERRPIRKQYFERRLLNLALLTKICTQVHTLLFLINFSKISCCQIVLFRYKKITIQTQIKALERLLSSALT